jgi:hypothetical protein
VSLCLFVPTKKATNLGKCSCETAERRDFAVLLFLFVPVKNPLCSSKPLIRFGVPIGDFFEHLSATIADATPFYELCASVLDF